MHRGSDVRVDDLNTRIVLDGIRRSVRGTSRVEVARRTGLSEQTVSTRVRRLINDGLVRETGRLVNGRGKPRTVLELNPHGMCAVGVHIDPVRADIVVVDLAGTVIDRSTVWIDPDEGPEPVLDQVGLEIERLLDTSDRNRRVVGVGVGAPGPIDFARGTLIDPPLLPSWRQVEVAEHLGSQLELPVVVEKDVIAAAAGEAWQQRQEDQQDFLFLYIGAGLGVGLVTGGEVHRGVSHNFGEIGHLIVADSGGPALACCGKVGTLGARTGLEHLSHRAVACGAAIDDGTMRGRDRAVEAMGQRAREGDRAALAEMHDMARALASGVSVFSDLLDVDQIVFGGRTWAHCADLVLPDLLAQVCVQPVLVSARPLRLRSARNPRDVVPSGAASLVLDEVLSPHQQVASRATVTAL